jgi:transcriptional regulator with XRE-family HTH domain
MYNYHKRKEIIALKNNRIQHLRGVLKLSQKDFGKRINLSQNQISMLEKGHRNTTDRVLSDISLQFNVNIEWLISGEEPIFNDVLVDMPLDDDVKELAKTYSTLDEKQRKLIWDMMEALQKKEDK